jgi:hypothetical protein
MAYRQQPRTLEEALEVIERPDPFRDAACP